MALTRAPEAVAAAALPPSDGSGGYFKWPCNKVLTVNDGNATFTYQHKYGTGRTSPWSIKLSPYIREIAGGNLVTEVGMSWRVSGKGAMPRQAGHREPASYLFHGTFNPVVTGTKFGYWDHFSFRHNLGSGGTATLDVEGAIWQTN